MSKFARYYFTIFIIAAACTCGARTECDQDGPAQISLLTSIHDDEACQIASSEGVLLYEASKLLLDEYNAKTNGFKLGEYEKGAKTNLLAGIHNRRFVAGL